MDPKQVIVVRKDLNMRKGKIAAQVAHASMWAILLKANYDEDHSKRQFVYTLRINSDSALDQWIHGHYIKICVSVDSLEELENIETQAIASGLVCHKQHDIGLTEFKGVRTVTCLAIGPDFPEKIDPITKHLPLL